MKRLEPCVQLPLEERELSELVSKAKDWALMHGAAMRTKTGSYNADIVRFAPFALFPSTFPELQFNKAKSLQTAINELIHRVAHDHQFLKETLEHTIRVDDFTRKLYEIYEKVEEQGGPTQAVSLGVLRADYMLDDVTSQQPGLCHVKQGEINTVAVSLAGIGSRISRLHRYVLQEINRPDLLKFLPKNDALSELCNGIAKAWELYKSPNAAVLIVVEDITYNICDQRAHEFYIRQHFPNIRVLRRSLTQIYNTAEKVNNQQRKLIIDGIEIAVVYFRAGYEPAHYHGPNEWAARELIEFSYAIKSPSIFYHLAGTKKVQQALAAPGVLEKFFPNDSKKVADVRDLFTGIFSLDVGTDEGTKAVKMALDRPEKYVLKPQREGGGNNVYGENIRNHLLNLGENEERNGWILQERICPPVQKAYLIRPGETTYQITDAVSELGIFGVIIGDKDKILVNEQTGHMLRTKYSTADEGGVAAGIGCLDSPFLTNNFSTN